MDPRDLERTRELLQRARRTLSGAPREALGALQERRRILGIARAPRIVAAGEAWHLGVLLLTDEEVLATGEIIRARAEAVRGFTAESQRARAAVAAAASRGGFADGQIVHIDWVPLSLHLMTDRTTPLAVREGVPVVRWSAAGGYLPLERYLAERIELLQHPPAGA
ncbi:glutaminase [Microbacterium sp. RD1]|uniref:glutaminase n=1 Tax=Microbacterium sp. RD1 TaxID=3457313 RepID=UPI003FA600A0